MNLIKRIDRLTEEINHSFKGSKFQDAYDDFQQFFNNVLAKECKQMIGDIKKMGDVLWRGTNQPVYEKQIPHKSRKPVDTPEFLHILLDKMFKKNFGWKPRSEGVFVSLDKGLASSYSPSRRTTIFMPVDGYKYLWSPDIDDLYDWLTINLPPQEHNALKYDNDRSVSERKHAEAFLRNNMPNNQNFDDYVGSLIDSAEDRLQDAVHTYKNDNIENAGRHFQGELIFGCKHYYLLPAEVELFLKNRIGI